MSTRSKSIERRLVIDRPKVMIVFIGIVVLGGVGWLLLRAKPAGDPASSTAKNRTALVLNSQPNFEETIANSAAPPEAVPDGMVYVPGGEFSMGALDPTEMVCGGDEPMDDSRPLHRVYVDG